MSIGERIRRARVAAGLTQDETVSALRASEGVSLTKAGLSKYERAGSTPRPTMLRALGKVLGVRVRYFLEEDSTRVDWLAFRKRARVPQKRQEQVRVRAEALLETHLRLRDALEPEAARVRRVRTRVSDPEGAEAAAEAVRRSWGLGSAPIPSVTEAIESAGGIVIELPDHDGFDGLSGWARGSIPVVVVNKSLSTDRRRFNLAHELGHLCMEVDDSRQELEEQLAHRFAAAFLVPAKAARDELGAARKHLDFAELALLKEKYGLSMQAWIYRARDLGIIDDAHLRTLFAALGARGWRRREPVEYSQDESSTRLRRLTIRALAEGVVSRSEAERIVPGILEEMEGLGVRVRRGSDPRAILELPPEQREQFLERAADRVAEAYEAGEYETFESLDEDYHEDSAGDG